MATFNADFIETVHAYGPATSRRRSTRAFKVDLSLVESIFLPKLSSFFTEEERIIDISYITNEMHLSFLSIIPFDRIGTRIVITQRRKND